MAGASSPQRLCPQCLHSGSGSPGAAWLLLRVQLLVVV